VALVVDENSNPFEMSCAIEVFGLRRPELGSNVTTSPVRALTCFRA